jgi:RNA polymerase sigma-70 factor (ECF subfamily)
VNELDLVKRARKEPAAFDCLYRKYYPKINAFVYHRVATEDVRHDIVSNTFLKAMSKIHMFRILESGRTSFSAWLYRIAMNEIAQYYRKKNSELRMLDNYKSVSTQDGEVMDYPIYDKIKSVMHDLKEEEKNLLALRFFEKLSFREIAEILKKKESAVKVRTHRILNKLRERLGDNYEFTGIRETA